ncbi:MAG: transcriptional repressor [Thermodesulfovibrionales bacterium]|nr:transcriptional repressor [Thermodesulfovibrionales bacterium]
MFKKAFDDFLNTRGLKRTRERQIVLEEINSIDHHFDPEELFLRLQSKSAKVSRASVYRIINLLHESGLIEKVQHSEDSSHYEKTIGTSHHDHMICLKCEKIIEFYSPTIEVLQDEICSREGFKPSKHILEIYGYCKDCADRT